MSVYTLQGGGRSDEERRAPHGLHEGAGHLHP